MVNPIWLYVPNLIGYTRIIFAILAFYFIKTDYILFFVFYALSAILDMADGHAARMLNQCSKLGAVLDMVTDRATTTCLIVVLSNLYPQGLYWFLFLIALDMVSHFAHIFSSLMGGGTSHKATRPNQNPLVKLYYTNRYVLAFLCFGNEGFFLNLYLYYFYQGPYLNLGPLTPLFAPIFGDATGQVSAICALVWFFYFPIMLTKQFMNWVQLQAAFEDLVEMETAGTTSAKTRTKTDDLSCCEKNTSSRLTLARLLGIERRIRVIFITKQSLVSKSSMANFEEATATGIPPLFTSIKSQTCGELLESNHREHHIFFNEDHFHNHFPHALLTYYALGADDERLRRELTLEEFLPIVERKIPEINEENWKDHIGDDSYYANYLHFFDQEVKKRGNLGTLLRYALDDSLLPCLLSGAVHGLIHTGFGMEFERGDVLAEGLAEGCVHKPSCAPLLTTIHEKQLPAFTAIDILNQIRADDRLNDLMSPKEKNKTDTTLKKASPIIREYLSHWIIEETAPSISHHLRELRTVAAMVTTATAFDPLNDTYERVRLDFFLMHVLTSSLSVRQIVPHLSPAMALKMMKAHFSVTLLYYIARGRPELQRDRLHKYPVERYGGWDDIVRATIDQEDLHVAKAVRALKISDEEYNESGDDRLWVDSARLIVDRMVNHEKKWDYSALGFVENWKEESK
ncbi:hypothetical protein PROFUN_01156 [Planoprotostelium fungivorum]|uniref:CDP-diacylglycerol--inositol 3-phosphatidyltransferase n=1 Tax=Planoprotostelium fungivorum TaxID=1890364 RepID=A0A2P6NCH0_9EUKA|nr:hypothetical protein PROFUN_01156 [Planoprotostelium fungivorum]